MLLDSKCVLITGAARRIGAEIARLLHGSGARLLLHCRSSRAAADSLAQELNGQRPDSAAVLRADLSQISELRTLAGQAQARWGRLDAVVNNASSYFATPLETLKPEQFDDLIASNLRAPLFLAQACAPLLEKGGSIINIIDVQARRPVADFAAYLSAKGGLWTLTEALALELAPHIRVNGVAPGHMRWQDNPQFNAEETARELSRIPLGRLGGEQAVARVVRFLLSEEAAYMTGAVIPVDGGLRLS